MKTAIIRCILMIQGITVYRRIVRLLHVDISVREANEEDERKFIAWLHPGRTEIHIAPDITCTCFIAEKGGRIIGSVELVRRTNKHYPYDGYWLSSLNVRIMYRGMGIGEELSQKVIAKSREEGAKELCLTVGENNHPAIRLYQKLGFQFKVVPELEKQFEQERDAHRRAMLLMCISLT